MTSHLQTRTLTDALDGVDAVLHERGTALQSSPERADLAKSFGAVRYPKFFDAWAFTAAEYDATVQKVAEVAPELATRLKPPIYPQDFTLVGNCALDLRFVADPNGAEKARVKLRNGTKAVGAKVAASNARVYANQLVELPASSKGAEGADEGYSEEGAGDAQVYFYSPAEAPAVTAAELASKVFAERGDAVKEGVALRFPAAKTTTLPEYEWVKKLESTCGNYVVRNFVGAGEARVDHNGFFAKETQVVQVMYRSLPPDLEEVEIDGPFLVFFADDAGVHAAAWFDWDAFSILQ